MVTLGEKRLLFDTFMKNDYFNFNLSIIKS